MVLKRVYLIFFITLVSLGLLTAGLFAAQTGTKALAQSEDTGITEETVLEQEAAHEAERSGLASKTATTLYTGSAVQYPLFVGLDDSNVPAYQIDPLTNDWIEAFTGAGVWGSAYDPDNDRVFFNTGTTLYEWPVGGAVNMLGTITDPGANPQSMVALAYHDGTLYGTKNIANEAVYIIDPNTLIATVYIDYVDADFDYGGLAADPNTGDLYGTNDDASPNGSGLFRINLDGSGTLIAGYPDSQTDIDGLAVSDDGYAYLVIDEPGSIYVYDFDAGSYTTPLNNPWTTSELFSGGAWIYEQASISMEKTVGLDPNVCANANMAFAPEGTEVTYCYSVLNTGSVTLTLHTLEDSQLGTLLLDFPYELTPGASVFVTSSVEVTATVVNTATWTAFNPGPSDVVTATDSATVYTWPAACPAGYEPVVVAAADFESFPPYGWSLTNSTTDCTAPGVPDWTNTDPDGRGNLTGGEGSFAIADSDACGSGSVMNATMTSAMLNFSGLISPTVTFFMDYNDISSTSDLANFDVSLDGGTSWNNIFSWNEDLRGPLQVGTPLPGAGEDDVMLRWDYQDATWDWWWEVDDVLVTACGQFPQIDSAPEGLSSTQVANQVLTHTLTISNVGSGGLDWMIFEEATVELPEQASLPEYIEGTHEPSAGQVPGAGSAAADDTPSAGIQAVLGTMVRTWNSVPGGVFTIFNLDTPDILPFTAPFTGTGQFIGAGEYVDGLSYMVDVANDLFVLDDSGMLVDQYTATAPPNGETYSGMALNPVTGEVYASSTNVATSSLFTFDVLTGDAVLVGPISGSPGNIAIAFDGAGNLFGYDIVNDSFMQIDPATGNTSNVVPLPFDANFGQGMGFDPATGMLYILAFNNGAFQAELWMVDTSSPAAPVFAFVDVLGSSLPGGLNQLSWGGTDNCFPGDIPWLAVSPSSGSTGVGLSDMVNFTFDATGLSPDTYTGTACIRTNDMDDPVVRVPLTLTVELGADLSLVKTASEEPVNPGETFEYTLVVENDGPDPANNTTLVDALPSGVTFMSASAGCNEAGGVVTCDLGTLAVGEVSEVSITVMAPGEEGVITNSASVSADETDINPADNIATVETTVMMYHIYLPITLR